MSAPRLRILLLHIMLAEGSSIENILDSISTRALLHSFTVMMKQYYMKRRKEKKVMLEEMKVRKAQGGYMNYLVPATSTSYTNNSRTI